MFTINEFAGWALMLCGTFLVLTAVTILSLVLAVLIYLAYGGMPQGIPLHSDEGDNEE